MNLLIRVRWLAACLAAVLPLCAHAGELRLGVSRSPLSLPLFVAQAQKFFEAEGVQVLAQECVGGHRCLTEVLEGRADLATAGDAPIMFRSFQSADFLLIASLATTWDDLKILARKAAGITGPRQLAGRSVGVVRGAASQYFLDSYLMLHGVDPRLVNVVAMQPEEAQSLLASGRVDAISIWEPYGFKIAQAMKGDIAVLDNDEVYNLSWNLVAHRRVTRARQAELVAFLRAVRRADKFIELHPVQAQEILKSRLGVDQAFIEWIWPHLHFGLSLEQALIKTLESQARWAIQEGHVPDRKAPNFLGVIHEAPLRAAQPAAVGFVR